MKANRRALAPDDAVSPVIATILMVAITVVLAATVYLFVSGFGSNQPKVVTASFVANAVDMPLGTGGGRDADNSDDVIELTYASGDSDLSLSEVQITVGGIVLTADATNFILVEGGTFGPGDLCTTRPGNDADAIWERGASLYLFDTSGTGALTDCTGGPDGNTDWVGAAFVAIHQVKVTVRNQVVFSGDVEVHDNGGA